MMIPLSSWEKMMEQLGNLHEAGQELAEARERAGRAEEREAFAQERRQIEQERREAAERKLAELEARVAGTPLPEPELPDIPDEQMAEVSRDLEELRTHQPKSWWRRAQENLFTRGRNR